MKVTVEDPSSGALYTFDCAENDESGAWLSEAKGLFRILRPDWIDYKKKIGRNTHTFYEFVIETDPRQYREDARQHGEGARQHGEGAGTLAERDRLESPFRMNRDLQLVVNILGDRDAMDEGKGPRKDMKKEGERENSIEREKNKERENYREREKNKGREKNKERDNYKEKEMNKERKKTGKKKRERKEKKAILKEKKGLENGKKKKSEKKRRKTWMQKRANSCWI